ncbi:MAG: membrane protein, partial [Gammaproteobacteria bacterium BRH_c0]
CHAILAVMLLSLATLNWLLRFEQGVAQVVPWGLYLSLLTGLLIAVTGILGGQLVYEYGVGVDTDETPP